MNLLMSRVNYIRNLVSSLITILCDIAIIDEHVTMAKELTVSNV